MGDLRDAFDATVKASSLIQPVDSALLEAGRKIADRVDEATAGGEGQEVTKALYLLPHMMNILREMFATPTARKAAGIEEKETASGTLASLQAQRRKKRTA
jgi:hypothetical protein